MTSHCHCTCSQVVPGREFTASLRRCNPPRPWRGGRAGGRTVQRHPAETHPPHPAALHLTAALPTPAWCETMSTPAALTVPAPHDRAPARTTAGEDEPSLSRL